MKKVLLTAMALLTLASASAFGMYGNNSDWIDFLVHGNQLRARMNQLGFTLGNGTIKGTFGFKGDTAGVIMNAVSGNENKNDNWSKLEPTISMGIGYTSPVFGIGVGYNYTMLSQDYGVHTPVLTVNALEDNLRIAVPVQIGVAGNSDGKNDYFNGSYTKDYTSISLDPQIRFYTGIDAVSHIRLTIKYGMASLKGTSTTSLGFAKDKDYVASSFGFEFRIHFLKSTVGNVVVDPFFRVKYNMALQGYNKSVTAASGLKGYTYYAENAGIPIQRFDTGDFEAKDAKDYNKPYDLTFEIPVGLNASSDIVTLYLEPRLGYTLSGYYGGKTKTSVSHSLVWGAYAELYLTPVKDLEWYFEADVGNGPVNDNGQIIPGTTVNFATSTGITWYLPSLNGAE